MTDGLEGYTELDAKAAYDEATLEKELLKAARGNDEIELFKILRQQLAIKDELANHDTVKVIVQNMWQNVAELFDAICKADNLIGLKPTDDLVAKHLRMRADWDSLGAINRTLEAGRAAEAALLNQDNEEN